MIKVKKISDFADVITGGTPSTSIPEYWDGDIPWINSGCLNDGKIKEPARYITELGLKKSSTKILPKDTVLVALTGSTTGQVGYLSFKAAANQSVTGILPSKEHFSLYLYYYLKSQRKKIRNAAFGGAQPHINQKYVKEFKVLLPKLEDQKRIAYLLNKVENLILQRKQSLQQLDELIKSIFIKMFGDPVNNEKGWDYKSCDKVVLDIFSGTSYSGEEKGYLDDDEYGVLKISAVTQGYFNTEEYKSVKKAIINKELFFVNNGDFLISRANTRELIAACCIVEEDYPKLFIPDKLWKLSFSELVTPQYFNFLLKNESFRNLIRKQASGGHDSMLNISMKKFRSLEIPIPPKELQSKFTKLAEKIIKVKKLYIKNLVELENLYNTISHNAFKGELDLTKVPIAIKIDLEAEGEQQVRFPESVEKLIELQERIISKDMKFLYDPNSIINIVNRASKLIELQDKIMPKGMRHLYDPNSAINIANRVSKFTDIPDYSSWQQSIAFDEEYEELENDYKQLNEQDIRQIFDHSKKALSFKELLDKLEKITAIDLQNYEFIKTILYKMLGNNELEQIQVDINKGKKDKPTEFILKFKRIVA